MKLEPQKIKEILEEMLKEYNFDPKETLEIIRSGIKTAFRKDYMAGNKNTNIVVNFDKEGNIKVFKELEVVEEVEDDTTQISVNDAQSSGDVEVGGTVLVDITPEKIEFSRIATQSAAQTIKQSIRQIEKERFYDKFSEMAGELLKGKVVRVFGENILVDIEGAMVILPPESQIPNKVYVQGEDIYVLLKQLTKGTGGIVLDITQTGTEFVESLLKKNIPEVSAGKVVLKKIARFAGKRTKVLVQSTDTKVDPVGVFVGQYGQRIESLLHALGGEKIDFVEYSDDLTTLIKNTLKPAKIQKIELKGNKAIIYADDHQKPVVIGKNAINLKLCSILTGVGIEVR